MPSPPRRRSPAYFSREVSRARRFYLNLRPRSGTTITVVSGGWELCAPGYRVVRASFPYLGLEYVASGRGTLVLGGERHSLVPGSLFAYGPGVSHRIESDPEAPLSKYFANFVGAQAEALLGSVGPAPGAFRRVFSVAEATRAFEDLLRAGQGTGNHAAHLAALYTEALLLTLADGKETRAPRDRRAHATYLRCRRHIEERFLQLRTLEQAARECHVEPAHLCRLFARFAGQSPYGLIRRLRMNHAADLLADGQYMVREVADRLGMDPFHFSRVFKQVHRLAPSAFLRRDDPDFG